MYILYSSKECQRVHLIFSWFLQCPQGIGFPPFLMSCPFRLLLPFPLGLTSLPDDTAVLACETSIELNNDSQLWEAYYSQILMHPRVCLLFWHKFPLHLFKWIIITRHFSPLFTCRWCTPSRFQLTVVITHWWKFKFVKMKEPKQGSPLERRMGVWSYSTMLTVNSFFLIR